MSQTEAISYVERHRILAFPHKVSEGVFQG